MSVNAIEVSAQQLLRVISEEMLKSSREMEPTLRGERMSYEAFLELEHESAKIGLMGRVARSVRNIFPHSPRSSSAVTEIRATWIELQKWNVSPELTLAFQVFEEPPMVRKLNPLVSRGTCA